MSGVQIVTDMAILKMYEVTQILQNVNQDVNFQMLCLCG